MCNYAKNAIVKKIMVHKGLSATYVCIKTSQVTVINLKKNYYIYT